MTLDKLLNLVMSRFPLKRKRLWQIAFPVSLIQHSLFGPSSCGKTIHSQAIEFSHDHMTFYDQQSKYGNGMSITFKLKGQGHSTRYSWALSPATRSSHVLRHFAVQPQQVYLGYLVEESNLCSLSHWAIQMEISVR